MTENPENDYKKLFRSLKDYIELLKYSDVRYLLTGKKILKKQSLKGDASGLQAVPEKSVPKPASPASEGSFYQKSGFQSPLSEEGSAAPEKTDSEAGIELEGSGVGGFSYEQTDGLELFSLDDEAAGFRNFEALQETAMKCTKCVLANARLNVVFGEGARDSRLIFIGEAPGEQEDIKGRPFVGRAGQLLDKMIEAMGYKRTEVYIANIIKCRPPGNRSPLPDEVAACLPYLKAQIAFIRPKVIVLLGSVAVRAMLQTSAGITQIRGKFLDYYGVPLMPTYHPAFLLRNPSKKREAWDDLKKVVEFLKTA